MLHFNWLIANKIVNNEWDHQFSYFSNLMVGQIRRKITCYRNLFFPINLRKNITKNTDRFNCKISIKPLHFIPMSSSCLEPLFLWFLWWITSNLQSINVILKFILLVILAMNRIFGSRLCFLFFIFFILD